jgi:hypothetical protein
LGLWRKVPDDTVTEAEISLGEGLFMGDVATSNAGPQHLQALEYANRVRLARAELKRQVAADETSVAKVVLESPWEAESMEISHLLMSQRRWGRARCRRLLVSLGLPENKQLGTLTERQRVALAAVLSGEEASRTVSRHRMLVPA